MKNGSKIRSLLKMKKIFHKILALITVVLKTKIMPILSKKILISVQGFQSFTRMIMKNKIQTNMSNCWKKSQNNLTFKPRRKKHSEKVLLVWELKSKNQVQEMVVKPDHLGQVIIQVHNNYQNQELLQIIIN